MKSNQHRLAVSNTAHNKRHFESFMSKDLARSTHTNDSMVEHASESIFMHLYNKLSSEVHALVPHSKSTDELKVITALMAKSKLGGAGSQIGADIIGKEKALALYLLLVDTEKSKWNLIKDELSVDNAIVSYNPGLEAFKTNLVTLLEKSKISNSAVPFNVAGLQGAISEVVQIADEEIVGIISASMKSLVDTGYRFHYRLDTVDNVEGCLEYGQLSSVKGLEQYWKSHIKKQKAVLNEFAEMLDAYVPENTMLPNLEG